MMVLEKEISLVSVIIPCYNCSRTIVETLMSLEKQSFSNIEVILVNDGSNDDTEEIINGYIERSNLLIRYFSKVNEGVSIARNYGISKAKGKYILFLDSDDVYHFDFVRCLVEAVDRRDIDTAYCYWSRELEDIFQNTTKVSDTYNRILSQYELMHKFLYNKSKIVFCGFIYRTDIIRKYSIIFTPFRKTYEDVEFTWKYLAHCNSGVAIELELYGYRNTLNSAVKAVYWERTESIKSIVEIEQYLKSHQCGFYLEFKEYMYSRAIWSYAKTFSRGKRKDLYDRLKKEYDVRYHMKKMIVKEPSWLVRVSSLLYCIHPNLFYYLITLV